MLKRTIAALLLAALATGSPATAGGSLAEKAANLDIARRVSEQLRRAGVVTVMTRWGDETRSPAQRVWIANRFGADAFVSVHNNASRNRSADHSEVYHQRRSSSARFLAEAIVAGLPGATGEASHIKTRPGRRGDYYWQLWMNRMPSVIVESAFVSNRRQAWLLATSPAYRDAIARAIADGVLAWQRTLATAPPEIEGPELRVTTDLIRAPDAVRAAVHGRHRVTLVWTASAQATAYHVRRDGRLIAVLDNSLAEEASSLLSDETAPMSFEDRWAAPGQTYSYEIVGVRTEGAVTVESSPASTVARTWAITVCIDAGHGGRDPGALGGW